MFTCNYATTNSGNTNSVMIFKTQINFSSSNVTPLSPVTMRGQAAEAPRAEGPAQRQGPDTSSRTHSTQRGCYCGTNLAEQSTLITSNNAASINHFQISLHCGMEDVEDVVG